MDQQKSSLKGCTNYCFSLILSLFLAHFMRNKQISMKSHSNCLSFHVDQQAQYVSRLYKTCVDLNEHSSAFGQRLHLTTRSQSHSLSLFSSLSLFHHSFFFSSKCFNFHFPKIVLFFMFLDFVFNDIITSFFSPFSQDNRSENVSRFCL